MPTIRVDQPFLLESLIRDLQRRVDVIAERTSPSTIVVNLLGSYNADAMEMEMLLRVRAWEAGQRARGIDVSVVVE